MIKLGLRSHFWKLILRKTFKEKRLTIAEYKLEVKRKQELVNEAIKVIKQNHPYEEFLINIFPLANHLFEMA